MEIVFYHLQALKYHPTVMLIPDIKSNNPFFCKLLPLLQFEPIIATKLQKSLMDELLQSLRADKSTYFTTKYQDLQYAPYILQAIQVATSSHYFIKITTPFMKI